jgi:tight adherence protein B
MRKLFGLFLIAAVAVVGVFAAPAEAQSESSGAELVIRSVDASAYPHVEVTFQVHGANPKITDFSVRENGKLVNHKELLPLNETGTRVGTVLVVDVSDSMSKNNAIGRAKDAAKQFIAQRHPTDRIAVVAFGERPRVIQRFTSDGALLEAAVDSLDAIGTATVLSDGIIAAADLFDGQRNMQPNMIVLTDSERDDSEATAERARQAARDINATVFPIGLDNGQFDTSVLERLADETGGRFFSAEDPTALMSMYSRIQDTLQRQYKLAYDSVAEGGRLNVRIIAPGLSAERKVNAGFQSVGQTVEPKGVTAARGVPFLQTGTGKSVAVGLVLLAVALAVYAIGQLVVKDNAALSTFLEPYEEGANLVDEDGREGPVLAETAFLKKAVQLTTSMAERQGILPKLEAALERADLPLRAGEALFFYVCAVGVLGLLSIVLTKSILFGVIGLVLAALLPPAVLGFLESKRRKAFMSQLPDMLQLLAGSLRAGYSLMQGVEAVSQEVTDPMGRELRRVVVEARLGRPLEEALEDCADRMKSPDFSWAVMAVRIQREVGGNLSELLLTVADTMVQRERLRRDVAALTAEGKISAIVLGILPVGIGGAMYMINPGYIEVLFQETIGNLMLGGAILLALGGFFWMKKTIEIEV